MSRPTSGVPFTASLLRPLKDCRIEGVPPEVDFLYASAPRILTVILQLPFLQKAEVSRPVEDNVIQQVDAYN